jgi:chromosome segregation ATPase
VRSLETEQRRLANSNFNLSREVASLDKMHSSVLQLLEDVEGVQAKFDLVLPEVRREISKLEFNWAQLNSQQAEVREEGRNRGKSIQALAVSVSALQAERDLRRVEEKQRTSTDQEEPLGATEQVNRMRSSLVGLQIGFRISGIN